MSEISELDILLIKWMESREMMTFDIADCQKFLVAEFINATITSMEFPNVDAFTSTFNHIYACPRCKAILRAELEKTELYPLLASLILAGID